jgi:hypothetical protein
MDIKELQNNFNKTASKCKNKQELLNTPVLLIFLF